jgi:hypothetical protein
MGIVERFWEDAAGILETASAVRENDRSEIAILIDAQQQLRIVDAAGWQIDALRREYQAKAAYTVKRDRASVVVEAQNSTERATLKKLLTENPLANLPGNIPYHLVRPGQALLP